VYIPQKGGIERSQTSNRHPQRERKECIAQLSTDNSPNPCAYLSDAVLHIDALELESVHEQLLQHLYQRKRGSKQEQARAGGGGKGGNEQERKARERAKRESADNERRPDVTISTKETSTRSKETY
jgi:hypothetical protein